MMPKIRDPYDKKPVDFGRLSERIDNFLPLKKAL
jgi:hypothetical protein